VGYHYKLNLDNSTFGHLRFFSLKFSRERMWNNHSILFTSCQIVIIILFKNSKIVLNVYPIFFSQTWKTTRVSKHSQYIIFLVWGGGGGGGD
jgi:hypothetical protein